jgi:glycerate dehydrogenase
MKIVVLDGYALNPGDLSWDGFREFADITVYERTSPGKVVERAGDAEMVLTNKTVLNAGILRSLPKLKYAGVLATGYNVVDLEEAGKLGITVTNIPAYSTNSVAQMSFALILELCHRVQKHSDTVFAGKWSDSVDFTYRDHPQIELASKTIGIIGYGNIGQKVGEIAAAFGMKVIVYSRRNKSLPAYAANVSLKELFQNSDIVSIHCPLTNETAGIINRDNLRLMKRSAFLINTSRGPLIVENDLAEALNSGIIAGAALDVLSTEPPSRDNPLLRAANCIITPHIAWATLEARKRLMETAVGNVKAFLSGFPVNVVNQV